MQSVLSQIDGLDASLERAVEAYNLATDKLHAIEGDLQVNLHELHIAKANLKRSQAALSKRLVTIYTSGNEANSTLGILLGAGSIDDMLSQIETSNRVSNQDLRINQQIIGFRADVRKHRIELKNAEAEAQALVQERADQRASIESQLAERKQLVSSIRSEIEQMKAEEARRQAELAQQARERAAAAAAAPAPIVSNESTAAPATTPSPVAASARRRRRQCARSLRSRCATSGSRTCTQATSPSALRLLRPHDVRLRPGRHLAPAQRGDAVRDGHTGFVRPAPAR